MWHELVLNGIGGKTIEQAKQNLTPAEVSSWVQYMNEYGSINTGRRLEWGFALLAMQINNALGGHKSQTDFMPYFRQDESEISLNEAMEQWK